MSSVLFQVFRHLSKIALLGTTASPQLTTILPFGIVDDSPIGRLTNTHVGSGVIFGTGEDGTTYIFPATNTDGSPYTGVFRVCPLVPADQLDDIPFG